MSTPTGTDTLRAPSRTHLSAAERTALGRSVSEARLRGESWDSISDRLGVNERTARRAMNDYTAHAHALGPVLEDPHAVLREVVDHHREALEDLTVLSREGGNMSARVGAARARAETARALLAVLSSAGVAPDTTSAWGLTRDLRAFVSAISEVCRRQGVPLEKVVEELDSVPGFSRALGTPP